MAARLRRGPASPSHSDLIGEHGEVWVHAPPQRQERRDAGDGAPGSKRRSADRQIRGSGCRSITIWPGPRSWEKRECRHAAGAAWRHSVAIAISGCAVRDFGATYLDGASVEHPQTVPRKLGCLAIIRRRTDDNSPEYVGTGLAPVEFAIPD